MSESRVASEHPGDPVLPGRTGASSGVQGPKVILVGVDLGPSSSFDPTLDEAMALLEKARARAPEAPRPAVEGLTELALDRAHAFYQQVPSIPGALAAAGLRGHTA